MKSTLSKIFKSLSLSVWAPIQLQKKLRQGSGVESGRIPHSGCHTRGVATFFFSPTRAQVDEKSIMNCIEVQKFMVKCLFWGGGHHPNPFVPL